jgi:hypothetical protein
MPPFPSWNPRACCILFYFPGKLCWGTYVEEIERRASDAKLIIETAEKYGIPVEMLWKPSGGQIAINPSSP